MVWVPLCNSKGLGFGQKFYFFIFCQYAFSVLLLLCALSIYPVSGIMSADPRQLSYKKLSFRFILSSGLLFFAIIETCCSIRWFIWNNFGVLQATSIVFFLSSTTSLYLFHFVARNWHDYVRYWQTHEKVFLSEPYPVPKLNLARLLSGIGCFTLLIAFG